MTLDELARLGTAFVRRDMRDHARLLRELYRATRDGRPVKPDRNGTAWDLAFAGRWARALRVVGSLPVQDRDYRCPCGGRRGAAGNPTHAIVLGDGTWHTCVGCGAEWWEVDELAALDRARLVVHREQVRSPSLRKPAVCAAEATARNAGAVTLEDRAMAWAWAEAAAGERVE